MTTKQQLELLLKAASAGFTSGLITKQDVIQCFMADEALCKEFDRLVEVEAQLVKLKAEIEEAKQPKAKPKAKANANAKEKA